MTQLRMKIPAKSFLFLGALLGACATVLSFNMNSAHADERIRPAAQLLAEGYKIQPFDVFISDPPLPSAHALNWPIRFQDPQHSIGNAMAQFQPFGDPYFHGGCDLRVNAGADITSPVSGRLEAGHYSYSTNPDGSMQKFWKAWPQTGDETYFEVAVIEDTGIRYEFHHVNRDTLPAPIVALLNQGSGRVTAGTLLGHAITWPDGVYHHTHYNIVMPSGVRVNPEFVSPLLPDKLAPEVNGVYTVGSSGTVAQIAPNATVTDVQEFVVAVVDHQDQNIYDHPPALISLVFSNGAATTWDFRQTLTSPSGAFPPLWEVLKDRLLLPSGETVQTDGGYGVGQSLMRLKVPPQAQGPFSITVADIAGNQTVVHGTLKGTNPLKK
jgi:hypothetical protein